MSGTKGITAEQVWEKYAGEWKEFFGEGVEFEAYGSYEGTKVKIGDMVSLNFEWYPNCCGVLVVSGVPELTNRTVRRPEIKTLEGLIRFIEKFAIHAGHGMVTLVGSGQKVAVKELLEKHNWQKTGEFKNPYHGMRFDNSNSILTVWTKQIAEETRKFFTEHPEADTY